APKGTAVLCHPLPTHGGSKDHPVLWAIRNELAANRGLTVVTFNFRGVMGSEGSFAGGEEEADVDAAIGRAREEAAGPTLLAGWSFGAHTALRHAVSDDRVAALALVGLPLGDAAAERLALPDPESLGLFDRPVLIVAGQIDHFSPEPDMRSLARRLPGAEVRVVPNTDHFFHRRERELAELVGEFADRALAPA
ncbi:MAG: hypothetical protein M3245_02350, partial [Actinomycetota bacterium]|nr:hypothetical protein [Actinomycetota bacterium]